MKNEKAIFCFDCFDDNDIPAGDQRIGGASSPTDNGARPAQGL